jgi:DNA adenine methylase
VTEQLKAPFPWFGGKSRVAAQVWQRFGDVPNYVEPFAGSLAVLLGRPHAPHVETVNDLDGYICNFWRAVQLDPEATAVHATNPVNECDLHARHAWLIHQRDTLTARLMGDPEYFDAKIAGWWCWGISSWIGSGWCSGNGPWQSVDGVLVNTANAGRGVNRKLPHLGNAGQGVNRKSESIADWFAALADRLSGVRVACGDWTRVCSSTVVERGTGTAGAMCGVFLDPPYPTHDRAETYTHDCGEVAYRVRDWAIANGGNPKLRIALCGYDGHWDMPDDWEAFAWKTAGGYGSQGKGTRGAANAHRERIWFSPHCLKSEVADLFGVE